MTSSADLLPPRRPIFFPVVIATVFLTIIGMTGGFMLGERHRQTAQAHQQQQERPQQEGPAPATDSTSVGPTTGGTECPREAIEFALKQDLATDLRQVFKLVTDNGTVVWICQSPTGQLFYQGKTGGVDKPLEQNTNGLFLPNVKQVGVDQYEVVDSKGTTSFKINRVRLQVTRPDGSQSSYQASSKR